MPSFNPDTLEDLSLKAAAAQLATAGHNASAGRAWTAIESLERPGSILTPHSADLAAVLKRKREVEAVLDMVTSSIRHGITLREHALNMVRTVRENAHSYSEDQLVQAMNELEDIGRECEFTPEMLGLSLSLGILCRQGWVTKEKNEEYLTVAREAEQLATGFWRLFHEIKFLHGVE